MVQNRSMISRLEQFVRQANQQLISRPCLMTQSNHHAQNQMVGLFLYNLIYAISVNNLEGTN